MEYTEIILKGIIISYLLYVICKILDDIEKKRKQKNALPKPKLTREEVIQRERRRTRWARRKAKKNMKKE